MKREPESLRIQLLLLGTSKNLTFQKSRIDKSRIYEALDVKIRGFSRCPTIGYAVKAEKIEI